MTEASTTGEPPAGSGGVERSQLSRVLRTFTEPAAVFRELAQRPTWLVALLVLVAASLAVQAVIVPRLDMEATIRQSLEQRQQGGVKEEEVERAAQTAGKVGKATMLLSPLLIPLFFLLVAGVYLLGLRALGSDIPFVSVYATCLHAALPAALVSNVLVAAVALQRDSLAAQEMESLVKSNLAAWLPPETAKPLLSLAGALDVFNVWQWILLVLGLEIVGRVRRGKAIALVAVVWGGWIGVKVLLAALA